MYNRLITIYIVILGFIIPLSGYAQPKYEIRATWLTTLGGLDWPSHKATSAKTIELQKQELCKTLDALKRANFNTVLFQTRLRGDVIYPSAIEQFTESLTGHEGGNPNYDPLKFAIEECHRRGMELHAWIVTIPIGNTRQVKLLGKKSVMMSGVNEVLNHEVCGHGLGRLMDEYVEGGYENLTLPASERDIMDEEWSTYKWGANVDWRSNANEVRWAHFLNDSRYAGEGLGLYEGAYLYGKGAYRPTENSMMRYNDSPFNAPSRERIYQVIMELSEGENWVYNIMKISWLMISSTGITPLHVL